MTNIITTRPIDVRINGGSSLGKLVLANGDLVAVIIEVSRADAGEGATQGGWFLEAGFGPCGMLRAHQPGIFESEGAALLWIEQRVERARH